MITKLSLSAFKSFYSKDIMLKPLTLLSGLNNSGKSSLIQAIRMYNKAYRLESPLLEGCGSVKELRSVFATQNEDVKVSFEYDDKSIYSMVLSDQKVSEPKKCPEVCYVGADRLGPQTCLPLSSSLDELPIIGDKGEFVLDFLEKLNNTIIPDKLIHPKSQGKTFEYALSGWLTEIAPGLKFNFNINKKTDTAYAEVDNFRPTNVGFGISYTLPILASILGMASEPPAQGWSNNWGEQWQNKKSFHGVLLLIENPEAHLHPQGQTAMGKVLALAASCGVQIILETHSDHLMDGIRIAVKNKEISSNDVLFHFLKKSKDGLSEIQSPNLHPNGKLDFWPEGFFDQTLRNRAVLASRG